MSFELIRILVSSALTLVVFAIVGRDVVKGDCGISGTIPLRFDLASSPGGYVMLVVLKAAIGIFFAWLSLHFAGVAPDPLQAVRGLVVTS